MRSIYDQYQEEGWVQVDNVVPVDFLALCREQVSDVISFVASTKGVDLQKFDTLNARFNALCDYDRSLGGLVYDCMRYHPLMQAMSAQPGIVQIATELLQPSLLFHVHDQIHFRIDRKNEDQFQLQWHQDYWYNNSSTKAVTVWIPLFDTSMDMGPMQIIDGSHEAINKVRVDPKFKTAWDQNKLITLAEDLSFESGECRPCLAGSAVFLNALTIHRSGRNTTDNNRFSIVLRYADLFDYEPFGKRWKTGINPGNISFLDQRPDLVVNIEELKAEGAL